MTVPITPRVPKNAAEAEGNVSTKEVSPAAAPTCTGHRNSSTVGRLQAGKQPLSLLTQRLYNDTRPSCVGLSG